MSNPIEQPGTTPSCPAWCCARHEATAHAEDRHHQSRPRRVALVTGTPTLEHDDEALPRAVVCRLVRRLDSDLVWLEVLAEEGRDVRLVVTLDSARRLIAALLRLTDHPDDLPQVR